MNMCPMLSRIFNRTLKTNDKAWFFFALHHMSRFLLLNKISPNAVQNAVRK